MLVLVRGITTVKRTNQTIIAARKRHNLVTIARKSLCHIASRGFDCPSINSEVHYTYTLAATGS